MATKLLRQLVASFEMSDSETGPWDGAFAADDFQHDDDDDDNSSSVSTAVAATSNNDDDDEENFVSRRVLSLPSNVCSICLEAIDTEEDLFTLDCNDVFCRDCLISWCKEQMSDVTRVLHKMAIITHIKGGIEIAYDWRMSIPCPGFGCTCLVGEPILKIVLKPADLERLNAVAKIRRTMLTEIEAQKQLAAVETKDSSRLPRKNGIPGCPRCGNFSVHPARRGRLRCLTCLLPLCATCETEHSRSLKCGEMGKAGHWRKMDKLFVEYLKTAVETRNCPKCNVLIEKNQGCSHMICRICKHDFQWYNARLNSRNVGRTAYNYDRK